MFWFDGFFERSIFGGIAVPSIFRVVTVRSDVLLPATVLVVFVVVGVVRTILDSASFVETATET